MQTRVVCCAIIVMTDVLGKIRKYNTVKFEKCGDNKECEQFSLNFKTVVLVCYCSNMEFLLIHFTI